MTVVGKILVFLNLIFSLAVGAFAVMSYTASSNHAQGFDDLKKRYEVVVATSESYKKDNDQLREQQKTFREVFTKRGIKDADIKSEEYGGTMARRVADVIDAKNSTIKALEGQLKIAKDAATKNDQAVAAADGKADASTTAMARRRKEVEDMRLAMGTLSKKNSDLTSKLATEMDQRVQAMLKATTLEDQVKQLEETQRELLRELQRSRSSFAKGPSNGGPQTPVARGPRPGGRDNPPPENVEGTVTRVSGDLVTISMGRDSGLEKGNTLQVFRLGTRPRYIGKIVLVEVEAKQAVGQVQGRASSPVQKNDRVASSILGGY